MTRLDRPEHWKGLGTNGNSLQVFGIHWKSLEFPCKALESTGSFVYSVKPHSRNSDAVLTVSTVKNCFNSQILTSDDASRPCSTLESAGKCWKVLGKFLESARKFLEAGNILESARKCWKVARVIDSKRILGIYSWIRTLTLENDRFTQTCDAPRQSNSFNRQILTIDDAVSLYIAGKPFGNHLETVGNGCKLLQVIGKSLERH